MDVRKYHDFGIGTYIANVLDQYDEISSDQFTLIAEPKAVREITARHHCSTIGNSSAKYSISELFTVSTLANRVNADVFHAPHYTLPLFLKGKSVVTIHDIIHLEFPEYFSAVQRGYAALMIRHACSSSEAIIVDSHFTKQELLQRFPALESKIHPIHIGVANEFFEKGDDAEREEFCSVRGMRNPYVLYTGSVKPHKNLGVLVRAFGMVRGRRDCRLVFAGGDPSGVIELWSLVRALHLEDSIVILGRISSKDLVRAYRYARCVVLPSLYEGFGLSLLEGMAAGSVAIGANVASMPEVVGDAGILFDPRSPEELAHGIDRVLEDDTLHDSLVQRGAIRARQFSWRRCAEQTLDVYRKVAEWR